MTRSVPGLTGMLTLLLCAPAWAQAGLEALRKINGVVTRPDAGII